MEVMFVTFKSLAEPGGAVLVIKFFMSMEPIYIPYTGKCLRSSNLANQGIIDYNVFYFHE